MNLNLYEAVIMGDDNTVHLRVPLEFENDFGAKHAAGHILRGWAVENNQFTQVRCYLRLITEVVKGEEFRRNLCISIAKVYKDGTRSRGPNHMPGISPNRTPEEKRARRESMPMINKVIWG